MFFNPQNDFVKALSEAKRALTKSYITDDCGAATYSSSTT
jgi:hypothetical protein